MLRPSAAILLGMAFLFSATAAPQAPPLCRVQVTSQPHALGRVLTVQVRAGCPPDGLARVRLDSQLGGSQPDRPPGAYVLRPGQVLRRVALPWWSVSWLDRSGRPWRVPEGP